MTDIELNDPNLTRDEVYRRLPTLAHIDDKDIRDDVIHLSRHAPEYFWIRPGSYSGYHNGTRRGLWHHTLKLSKAIETLAPSRMEMGVLTPEDTDLAHAAAIIHDQWKNGADPESDQTSDAHPHVAATLIREHTDLNEVVARAVREHMGAFDGKPHPSSAVSSLVHDADMLASDDEIRLAIASPVPSELDELVDETYTVEE